MPTKGVGKVKRKAVDTNPLTSVPKRARGYVGTLCVMLHLLETGIMCVERETLQAEVCLMVTLWNTLTTRLVFKEILTM